MKTLVFKNDTGNASEIIIGGGVVAVPTETVYGLAANGLDVSAVEKVYAAKGRPEVKPVSLFVLNMKDAEKFCRDIPESAYKLAEKYWPGPLTMIFRRRSCVPDIITAGGENVGVRCPDNELTLELLRETDVPLTGTSANISGGSDSVNADQVKDCFGGKIECIIDGGVSEGGVPSTVIDMTKSPLRILREGAISRLELIDFLGVRIV